MVVVVAALLLVSALPGLHTSPAFLPEDFQYDMEAAAPNQYEDGYLQGEAVMEEPTLVPVSDEDDRINLCPYASKYWRFKSFILHFISPFTITHLLFLFFTHIYFI